MSALTTFHTLLLRVWVTMVAGLVSIRRNQRGDVPGWVLITVMTATIVVGLGQIAGPQLKEMLVRALNSVK